jgi:L-Ala-D/L-Glu epimerase
MRAKILRAEIWRVLVPLRLSFRHASAERSSSENVVLILRMDGGGIGCGEAAPREYVTGETAVSVAQELKQRYVPAVMGETFSNPEEVKDFFRSLNIGGAASCVLELALLDGVARSAGRDVHWLIGPPKRPSVSYSAVIPLLPMDSLARIIKEPRWTNFHDVKIKVNSDLQENVQRVSIIREALGPKANLRVDANEAWDPESALRHIRELEKFQLSSVEEPIRAHDLDGLAYISRNSSAPICVDESLTTLEDAQNLADKRACHIFNIRISKCGGLLKSMEIASFAERVGMSYQVGCQVGESSILSAAGRRLLMVLPSARFAEGSYGRLLLDRDIGCPPVEFDSHGVGAQLTGPGLGSAPNFDVLDQLCIQKEVLGIGL